jgi:AhpD family alkylhydroperoxidase
LRAHGQDVDASEVGDHERVRTKVKCIRAVPERFERRRDVYLKALDTRTKELMSLAIGIAVHCDGCVAYHTKMAHQHGATREEVAETVALARRSYPLFSKRGG